MSGGKTGFPDHTGKDTDQPLAQDHHGGTRFTGTMWISCRMITGNDGIKL